MVVYSEGCGMPISQTLPFLNARIKIDRDESAPLERLGCGAYIDWNLPSSSDVIYMLI